MKRFLVVFLAVMSLIAMLAMDAQAGRIGGGRSVGRQSSNVSRQQAPAQQPSSANQTRPAPAPAAGVPRPSPWKGMLGGALLGLGLGALLSSLGVGAGMANMISMLLMAGIVIMVLMLLMRLFRQKAGPAQPMNYAYPGSNQFVGTPQSDSRVMEFNRSGQSGSSATWSIPADFDVPQFERAAQTYFIRLQAAWDKADIADIAEFTTPEMYAEIKMELQERGPSASFTDVISVNAKLLGVETHGTEHMASVRFVGTIREAVNAPTESFEEIWNLTRPVNGQTGWVLAGIQQA